MSDLLAKYHDDDGNIRMHKHTGYVQIVPSKDEFFPICEVCGMLTKGNQSTRKESQTIVDVHCRNSGVLVDSRPYTQ